MDEFIKAFNESVVLFCSYIREIFTTTNYKETRGTKSIIIYHYMHMYCEKDFSIMHLFLNSLYGSKTGLFVWCENAKLTEKDENNVHETTDKVQEREKQPPCDFIYNETFLHFHKIQIYFRNWS
jgi:hypothetical protein